MNKNVCPKIFILHGPTSIGKTYINKKVKPLFLNLKIFEMEKLIYYNECTVNAQIPHYKNLFKKVMDSLQKDKKKEICNLENFLNHFSQSRYVCVINFIIEVLMPLKSHDNASATCAKLPRPDPDSLRFYKCLEVLFQVKIIHILVTASIDDYRRRLMMRHRDPKYAETELQGIKTYYDGVIKNFEEFVDVLQKNGLLKAPLYWRVWLFIGRVCKQYVKVMFP